MTISARLSDLVDAFAHEAWPEGPTIAPLSPENLAPGRSGSPIRSPRKQSSSPLAEAEKLVAAAGLLHARSAIRDPESMFLGEAPLSLDELELELFGIVRSGSPRGRRGISTSPLRRQPGSPGSSLGSPVKSPGKAGSVRGDMSDAFWAHLDALFVRDSSSSIPPLERATAVADLARNAGRSPTSDSYAARAERSKALAQYFEEETARYAREYEAVIAQRAAWLSAGF